MAPFSSFFKDLEEEHRRRWRQPASWWSLLVLFPVLVVVPWYFYSLHSRANVAARQQFAIGTVDIHDPANHDRYGYIFAVGENKFRGWAYPHDQRDYSVGESITVFYDPQDPTTNSPEDFHEVASGNGLTLGWCLLVSVAVPVYIALQRRAAKKKATTSRVGN